MPICCNVGETAARFGAEGFAKFVLYAEYVAKDAVQYDKLHIPLGTPQFTGELYEPSGTATTGRVMLD